MPHVTFDANITITGAQGQRLTLGMAQKRIQRLMIDSLNESLKDTVEQTAPNYWKQTNKKTGSKIKSKHISNMLYFDISGDEESRTVKFNRKSGKVLGNVLSVTSAPRKKPVKLSMYLEDKEFTGGYWEKIAEKQERGGLIRAKRSKVLTIPNPSSRRVTKDKPQLARAGMYKAKWIKPANRDTAMLIEARKTGKQQLRRRKERIKPKSRATRRKPKAGRPGAAPNILFFGFNNVRLRPKKFWATTVKEFSGSVTNIFLGLPHNLKKAVSAQFKG